MRILNASGVAGVGAEVATGLEEWDFPVVGVVEDAYPGDYPEVAALVHGPRTVGAAWLVRSHFAPPVRLEFGAEGDDATVDVIVGRAFTNLLTVTEVNQELARYGPPTAPPGPCVAESTVD